MTSISALGLQPYELTIASNASIDQYFNNLESLEKSEKWEEIIRLGTEAVKAAKNVGKNDVEAKICAKLASTAFYMGNYTLADEYANRCQELLKDFADPSLCIQSLYLQSAIHRAFANKQTNEDVQQQKFQQAVATAEKAVEVYLNKKVDNEHLIGKVYFNLGAAYGDNPKGDLEKAALYYKKAVEHFEQTGAEDEILRINIRLGKVYLLRKQYQLVEQVIKGFGARKIVGERLLMHIEYLKAQFYYERNDFQNALNFVNEALTRARVLGAYEERIRITALISRIQPETPAKTVEAAKILTRSTTATSLERKPAYSPFLAAGGVFLIGYVVMRIFSSTKH